jgi:energy-coupling factor transporter ATP-binding protein EcfA2
MKARVWISNIKFSDGSKIDFNPNQITVFVGPNNAGKSATLKELNSLTRIKNREGKVVKDFTIVKEGTLDDLLKFIKEFSIEQLRNPPEPFYHGYKFEIYKGNLEREWSNKDDLHDIQPAFINLLTTEERLTITNPPESISLTTEAVKHPIHFIQKDDTLEFKFCSYYQTSI